MIHELCLLKANLLKESIEYLDVDLGKAKNNIEYRNYLINNPILIDDQGKESVEDFDGEYGNVFTPDGFYSDETLIKFVSLAEGAIAVQWVKTYKGHDLCTSCGVNGWDLPGGLHNKQIASKIGVSASDLSVQLTNSGRRALEGEIHEGASWGWYTTREPLNSNYWSKFVPYYREQMLWAWDQPIIQAVKDPAERLARMHSVNWYGYHNLKLFNGGPGWKHRLEAAKQACS